MTFSSWVVACGPTGKHKDRWSQNLLLSKNYTQRHTKPHFCDSGLNEKITRPCYVVTDRKLSTLLASSRLEYLASAMLWFRYRWKLCSGPCCMHSVFRVDPSICQQTTKLSHPVRVPTHIIHQQTTRWLFITDPKWRNNYGLFKKKKTILTYILRQTASVV